MILLPSGRTLAIAVTSWREREANVRYYENNRGFNWPHASAALALDRYLDSPLDHERDRASRA
ncbi:hypothetical protein [Kribbella sp. NPDC004875]|uniref:hypothetical protein n=1 Tax=Kribbella sp. NPDC004875 TaxID=3364107 RepID=UPI00368BF9B8